MEINKINLALCSTGELYGGVEQFIYTFSNSLRQEVNIAFIVVLFHEGLLHSKLKDAGIETYIIPSNFKYDFNAIRKTVKLFKEKEINIVHNHGYKANILCSIAAKVCNAKIIKTEHGKQEPSKGLGYYRMSFNLFLDRFISKYLIDHVVFVSKDIQTYYNNAYSGINYSVIYNGINIIEIGAVEENELDNNNFNIGIIGRICSVKGHIYLLKALKRLQQRTNIHLYIFGEGPLETACKEYCVMNNLSERVHFMGFKKDIYSYMRTLDVLVMPSLHEGLPYTILEAMSLKVPIIASDVGGLKDLIDNNRDGILVQPQDEQSLANAIEQVYQNIKLRDLFAKNAYEKVCSKFSAGKMTESYVNTYFDILE